MAQRHYFTDNRDLPSNRKNIEFRFMDKTFTFVTDDGVFSKSSVDTGTRILLNSAVRLPLAGEILDLGCGYGVIGIVVKTIFPACGVTCSDVNSRALELTKLNAVSNSAAVGTVLSDRFSSLDGMYDVILTNPPVRAGKQVVHGMLEESYAHLNSGGFLLAVIRRKQGAESALKKMEEVYDECGVLDRDKGFWILQGIRR